MIISREEFIKKKPNDKLISSTISYGREHHSNKDITVGYVV